MRYFSEKILFGPFSLLREVSKINKEILSSNNPAQYIKDNNITEKLKEIYWSTIYGDVESAKIAFNIIEETIFLGYSLMGGEEVLDLIKNKCKEYNREDLYNKIVYTCPNGDSVVHLYIKSLLNS